MKIVIPFKKNILFNTNLCEITSISLEDNLSFQKNSVIGCFVVSGDYKMNDSSINTESFNYELPVEINIDEKYNLSKSTVEVSDFYYEIINDNTLNINIEVTIDKLEEIPIIEEVRNSNEKLDEINLEITNLCDEFVEKEEKNIEEKDDIEDSNTKRCVETEETLFKYMDSNENYSTYNIYIVREGDTIESILAKYNIDKEKVEEYNDLKELKIGDKLIIPNNV